jgi:hypothetical protein
MSIFGCIVISLPRFYSLSADPIQSQGCRTSATCTTAFVLLRLWILWSPKENIDVSWASSAEDLLRVPSSGGPLESSDQPFIDPSQCFEEHQTITCPSTNASCALLRPLTRHQRTAKRRCCKSATLTAETYALYPDRYLFPRLPLDGCVETLHPRRLSPAPPTERPVITTFTLST